MTEFGESVSPPVHVVAAPVLLMQNADGPTLTGALRRVQVRANVGFRSARRQLVGEQRAVSVHVLLLAVRTTNS